MQTSNFSIAKSTLVGEWSSVLEKLPFFTCDDYDLKNAITGVALKSESGNINDLLRSKDPENPEDYSLTALYEHPTIKKLVDSFKLETTRIRIFKQEPNKFTSLHVDYNNTNAKKEEFLIRIWTALNEDESFEYYFQENGISTKLLLKKGQSVIFNPDKVYHGAYNKSTYKTRYSLNIIAKPNNWLKNFINKEETIVI